MSIAALNTASTVLRVGFYGVMGISLIQNIFPSWIVSKNRKITEGDLFNFTKEAAKNFDIKKEVILIKARGIDSLGNNVLPGSAIICVRSDTELTDQTKNQIESHMAAIRLNAYLIIGLIPTVLAIAARCLLIARFPIGATLAELGIGIIAVFVTRDRYSSAITECVSEVRLKNKG